MSTVKMSWYVRRFLAMSPSEVKHRLMDRSRQTRWMVSPPRQPALAQPSQRHVRLAPPDVFSQLASIDHTELVNAANRLLAGSWTVLRVERHDLVADVDYYRDPKSGTRAPSNEHAFRINHRDEATIGNIKNIWEVGRHQHLSVLAAAYAASKDERYAQRIRTELDHYFTTVQFCRGVHWMSGIELGVRMISWVWIRRLLDGWDGAGQLFEGNPLFRSQLGRHHQWLETFPAHGSSANNHLIAECCGSFVASCGFALFTDSKKWMETAANTLAIEAKKQTFGDGLNRELASDYHGFVTELLTVAYVEAAAHGHPLADALQPILVSSYDALAAICDQAGNIHAQGDADEGHGLLLDPNHGQGNALLPLGNALIGGLDWWPEAPSNDVRTTVLAAMSGFDLPVGGNDRPTTRPSQFLSAGQTILRTLERDKPEIWVRFDHGPHGYLSTAAHAHADALAIEVRVDGLALIVDPGTYCYHGETEWRDYFRSTIAHSTIEVGGTNQSDIAGAFLWRRHCVTTFESAGGLDGGDNVYCRASHSGYEEHFGLIHRRTVVLDRPLRTLRVTDEFLGPRKTQPTTARIAFHFHPRITIEPNRSTSKYSHTIEATTTAMSGPDTVSELGKLQTDDRLEWSLTKGKTQPPLGWYSHSLGHREPCWVLIGQGPVEAGFSFDTTLTF